MRPFRRWLSSAAMILGAAAFGYWLGVRGDSPSAVSAVSEARPTEKTAADEAGNRALNERVRELEERLKAARRDVSSAREQLATATNAVSPAARRPRGPGGFQAEMERLKAEDPKRYSEIRARWGRMRERRRDERRSRMEYLADADVSLMNDEELSSHVRLLKLMQRQEALEEEMQSESLDDAGRMRLVEELRGLNHELHELNGTERQTLLRGAFEGLGLAEGEAADLIVTVEDIVEQTRSRGFHGGRPAFRDSPRR